MNLSCSPVEREPLPPRVKMWCLNHYKVRAVWDGHTYRCPECDVDVGRYAYEVLRFSFHYLQWDDVCPRPDEEDAMTWVGCSPEESAEITKNMTLGPPHKPALLLNSGRAEEAGEKARPLLLSRTAGVMYQ